MASQRLASQRLASQRFVVSCIFPMRNMRHSNFSTHTNGFRGDVKGFSYLGFGWSDVVSSLWDLTRKKGCVIVPEGSIFLVERSRKYDRELGAGLKFMIPFKDRISYIQSLKVKPLEFSIPRLFSKDQVELKIKVCLFYKVVDPYLASYEVDDLCKSITLLADTIVQKNVGRKTLDELLHERETLNKDMRKNMCDQFKGWGLTVLNVEIRDICFSENMKNSMMLEARKILEKNASIIKSEADRDSMIIIADAKKSASILLAEGEAEAEVVKEEAKGQAILKLAKVMKEKTTDRAVMYKLLSKAVDTFGKIAEHSTTFITLKQ